MAGYKVKSAVRVLELLEFFSEWRRGATVNEICKSLDYPQSSTSILLKCLHETGYFDHDLRTGFYSPNVRLALATAWIGDHVYSEQSLLSLMERIRRTSGHTVMIGAQHGVHVQYLHVLRSERPNNLVAKIGWLRPLFRSASGKMILTTKTDRELSLLLRRANSLEAAHLQVEENRAKDERDRSRRDGFAMSKGVSFPDAAALAVLLPVPPGTKPLSLALGGPTAEIERDRDALFALLQEAVRPLGAVTRAK